MSKSKIAELLSTYKDICPLILVGKPGTGKTTQVIQWAEENKLSLYFINAMTVGEVHCLPLTSPNGEQQPPLLIAPKGEIINADVVLIDELGNAEPAVQKSLHELVQMGSLAGYKLPGKPFFVITSNDEEDAAYLVQTIVNRGALIQYEVTADEVINYAISKGWHPFVIAYMLKSKKVYSRIEGEYQFMSPRSLENLSKLLHICSNPSMEHFISFLGKTGPEVYNFWKYKDKLEEVEKKLEAGQKKWSSEEIFPLYQVMIYTIAQPEKFVRYLHLVPEEMVVALLSYPSVVQKIKALIDQLPKWVLQSDTVCTIIRLQAKEGLK
jgi:hypothetical protein